MDSEFYEQMDNLVIEYLKPRFSIIHYAYKVDVSATAVPISYQQRTFLVTAWHALDSDRPGGLDWDAIRFGWMCDDPPYEVESEMDGELKKFKIWGCALEIRNVFSSKELDVAAIEVDRDQLLDKMGIIPFEEHQIVASSTAKVTNHLFGYPSIGIDWKNSQVDNFNKIEQAIAKPVFYQTVLREKPGGSPRKISRYDFFLKRDEELLRAQMLGGMSGGGVGQIFLDNKEVLTLDRHMQLTGIFTATDEPSKTDERYFRCTSIDAVKFVVDRKKQV